MQREPLAPFVGMLWLFEVVSRPLQTVKEGSGELMVVKILAIPLVLVLLSFVLTIAVVVYVFLGLPFLYLGDCIKRMVRPSQTLETPSDDTPV